MIRPRRWAIICGSAARIARSVQRSEEHTSELQSRSDLVCRLLLEKKKSTISSNPEPRNTGTYTRIRVPSQCVLVHSQQTGIFTSLTLHPRYLHCRLNSAC